MSVTSNSAHSNSWQSLSSICHLFKFWSFKFHIISICGGIWFFTFCQFHTLNLLFSNLYPNLSSHQRLSCLPTLILSDQRTNGIMLEVYKFISAATSLLVIISYSISFYPFPSLYYCYKDWGSHTWSHTVASKHHKGGMWVVVLGNEILPHTCKGVLYHWDKYHRASWWCSHLLLNSPQKITESIFITPNSQHLCKMPGT